MKARAALDGRSVRDVTIELYERWLSQQPGGTAPGDRDPEAIAAWIRRWRDIGERVDAAARAADSDAGSTREQLIADRR